MTLCDAEEHWLVPASGKGAGGAYVLSLACILLPCRPVSLLGSRPLSQSMTLLLPSLHTYIMIPAVLTVMHVPDNAVLAVLSQGSPHVLCV